ncbi:MAG: folylpolyglutamate synthase/dihydrofolate synthase family protein [Prevotella sp.]|nr:bifunctional folylpolyglutamate synthase/dihydrofolate synthase [Prevotella sp.]MDY4151671.1 folylpolyglutamate synthase/dihydrofolate synthase family protein [Prevotella sp.]
MNYQETLNYLYNSTPVFEHVGAVAYKEGLQNTLALDKHFNHPHTNFKTIHIAGTNGKGSCSHSLASILQEAGYKVGLYTSPHLVDFRERIRVNGQCISKERVVKFVEDERKFFEPLHPSFFELTTALAFKYFDEQKVDIAIIEVGLGGRLDCTNIISPILSIITNISFDHTQFLGDTLAKIAAEKAGIIKKGVPVIIGEANEETSPVFQSKANEVNSDIVFAEDNAIVTSSSPMADGGRRYYLSNNSTLVGELSGDYQERNMNTILCACNILKQMNIIKNDDVIAKGLTNICKNTGLLGRWQTIQNNPTVVCDTGHNVGGWNYLAPQIKRQQCNQLRIVFGMVDDKDINSVMYLLPKNAIYYWTQAESKRAIKAERVAEIAIKHDLRGEIFDNVEVAYTKALQDSNKDDFVFVGGSSYIVADLLTFLSR